MGTLFKYLRKEELSFKRMITQFIIAKGVNKTMS